MKIMKAKLLVIMFLCIFTIMKQSRIETILETENPLLIVTNYTLKTYLSQYDKFFILIHSPWCKWSQKLESILLKINRHLKLEPQNSYIGIIDQTLENFNEHFKESINNGLLEFNYEFPTILYFEKGKRKETYKDRLEFDVVFHWIKR